MKEYSFVIPVYNEKDNLIPLNQELQDLIQQLKQPSEIIWVDDGSRDGSLGVMKELVQKFQECRYLGFEKNCGQSAALDAGFKAAKGRYIITMDSDLQNNPMDIVNMLPYLKEYDMVTGWRKNRHDNWWKKSISWIANSIRNRLSRERINDTGCSLKIMKSEYVKNIKMYKGLHRFLPTLIKMEGGTVIEVPVSHRKRTNGVSKYGIWDRAFSGLRDLLTVRWMQDRKIYYEIKEKSDEY